MSDQSGPTDLAGWRVLAADDDADHRVLLGEVLTRAGADVVEARDGAEAVEAFHRESPDLVVLDVTMPRVDGWEALARIRTVSQRPVLMLTAADNEAMAVRALKAGADDYVRKPFEVPELVARVRAALRRGAGARQGEEPAQLRLGPLVIDLAGRSVTRDGSTDEIPLTRTEFELLVDLARHPGQVLARDTLLDRIWGYDYLGDSRLVDVAVGRLRAKVERDPAEPELILTVRGAGYKAAR
jgi:two-component system, OmpR family, response regulator MtrA